MGDEAVQPSIEKRLAQIHREPHGIVRDQTGFVACSPDRPAQVPSEQAQRWWWLAGPQRRFNALMIKPAGG